MRARACVAKRMQSAQAAPSRFEVKYTTTRSRTSLLLRDGLGAAHDPLLPLVGEGYGRWPSEPCSAPISLPRTGAILAVAARPRVIRELPTNLRSAIRSKRLGSGMTPARRRH